MPRRANRGWPVPLSASMTVFAGLKMRRKTQAVAFGLMASAALWAGGAPAFAEAAKVDFNRDIRPIPSENCLLCHGPDPKNRKAKMRLDTPEGATADLGGYAAVVPGKPDKSEMVTRITTTDPDDLMPPPKSGKKLANEQIEL